MAEGIVVATTGDVPDGEGIAVAADVLGTVDDVAVFNDGGEFYALDDTCSHEKASLAEGWVEHGAVECPLHSARFCLADGSVLSMPATRAVACHRVVVDGDDIRVVPDPGRLRE